MTRRELFLLWLALLVIGLCLAVAGAGRGNSFFKGEQHGIEKQVGEQDALG
jgi:hypothetical protein